MLNIHCASADGYIATQNGESLDCLENAKDLKASMGKYADIGFNDYMNFIDCIVMGRKFMEKISKFILTPE